MKTLVKRIAVRQAFNAKQILTDRISSIGVRLAASGRGLPVGGPEVDELRAYIRKRLDELVAT